MSVEFRSRMKSGGFIELKKKTIYQFFSKMFLRKASM